jgi:hypothetical protein
LGAQFGAFGPGPLLSVARLHQQRHQSRHLRDLAADAGFLAIVECPRGCEQTTQARKDSAGRV